MGYYLILGSGAFHALWNLWAKASRDRVVFLWSFQMIAVATYYPWAWMALTTHGVSIIGWEMLLGTAALHGIYVLLLVRTYSLGDLSEVYPLMRGVSPLAVPLIGVMCMGEHLTWLGWGGIVLVVCGIGVVGGVTDPRSFFKLPRATLASAIAVGVVITGYTIWDKLTLRYVPAVTLNDVGNLANFLVLSGPALRVGRRAITREWRANWSRIGLAGVISPGAYLLFLLALQRLPLAQVAPMREVGTVFGTVLGVWVLREAYGARRIVGAGLIALGVLLLGVFG